MMMKAAVPILDINNEVWGVIYGGSLLNRNYEIVDRIKDAVFRGRAVPGERHGHRHIMQWDLRISTNVRDNNRLRAIGTRVSKEVYDQVLEMGRSFIDRAFVVSEWYIAAYEPVRNIKEK